MILSRSMLPGLALVAPALAMVAGLFLLPLTYSIATAFTGPDGAATLDNFRKAFELYSGDIVYTIFIVVTATAATAAASIAIAGILTLSGSRTTVALLAALYRLPLFIPFIVAAQCMRTFLARNGLMNNTAVFLGMDPSLATSFLDWRGIVITFVWKQTPFVTLLLAGAMASLDRSTIEAARNLGASRPRTLFAIVLPQVLPNLFVALTLSFVTMLSVLSVPMMVAGSQPTMLTVDMAFRINAYGDYGVANALGVVSYAMTAVAAVFYLRHVARREAER